MSYWRTEYDDGWWTFYKDGIEIKFDNPNFGDLIVDEINNANLRIAELEAERRWIPVEERLPEESDWTLIRYKGYRVPYTLYYDIDRGWACGETPDYWMSLPEMQEVNNE